MTTPCIAAYEELSGLLEAPGNLKVSCVEDESRLRELWTLDREAYGDLSLEFQPFLEWWSAYPRGSILLLLNNEIAASMGIYPLQPEQAEAFLEGRLHESALRPATLQDCEHQGISHWYGSGIVIRPDLQHRGILRRLIEISVGTWLSSQHVAYPAKFFGLAEYEIGGKIMRKLGLTKWREGSEMADGFDLYGVGLTSEQQARSLLRLRGA